MATRNVTVEIDYRQPRPSRCAIGTLIRGREVSKGNSQFRDGWSPIYKSNTYVIPVCKSLILLPGPADPLWLTSNSNQYAKLTTADFNFTTSAKWGDKNNQGGAYDLWIYGIGDTTAEKALSKTAWGENRGCYIGFFDYGQGNDDSERLVFGWGTDTAHTDDSLWCKVRNGGVVQVFYGTTQIGEGSLEGKDNITDLPGKSQNANTVSDLMVMPYRSRDVLIYSINRGGGFVVRLPEDVVADKQSNPIIIRSTDKFFFYQPTGSAQVQPAKLAFAGSGYACSVQNQWVVAPPSSTGYTQVKIGDDSRLTSGTSYTVSLRNADNSGAFALPNMIYRVRADLTGDATPATKTPIIFAAGVEFEEDQQYTDDSQAYTLDPYVVEMTLSVPDAHESAELRVVLKEPKALEAFVDRIRTIGNRAIRLIMKGGEGSDLVIFEGITGDPEWTQSFNDEASRLTLTARSLLGGVVSDYVFESAVPLLGYSLEAAFSKIANKSGMPPEYITCSVSGFMIDDYNPTAEELGFEVQYHEKGGDALNRLVDAYAANWIIREKPGPDHIQIEFLSPDDLMAESDYEVEIFDTLAARDSAMPVSTSDSHKYLVRSYNEKRLHPEANDITVVGMDPKTYRAIIAHKADDDSQDPTTVPSARPANWLGQKAIYDFRHTMITDLAGAEWAVDKLSDRLFCVRRITDIDAELIEVEGGDILWKCGQVKLTKDDDEGGVLRIMSLHINFEMEPESDTLPISWRDTKYCAQYRENGNIGAPTRTSSTNAPAIAKEWELKKHLPKGFEDIGKILHGFPLVVAEVP